MGISLILDEISFANEVKAGSKEYLGVNGIAKYLTKLYIYNLGEKKFIRDDNLVDDIVDYIIDFLQCKHETFDIESNYELILKTVQFYTKRNTFFEIKRYQCYEIDDIYDFLAIENIMKYEWNLKWSF